MSDIVDKVRELSRIKADIAKLSDRKKQLEAYFLERGGDDVVDTKFKSATYSDPDSQAAVTYTEAESLTIVFPEYLKETLGEIFKDMFDVGVKTEVKPKNKDIERMLIGMLYQGILGRGDSSAPLRRQVKGGSGEEAQGCEVRDRPGQPHEDRRLLGAGRKRLCLSLRRSGGVADVQEHCGDVRRGRSKAAPLH